MQFLVLGPVEIAADNRRVTLGSSRQRVLLAVLLAARGQAVSSDRLIDAIWDDTPPPSAQKSLHSHVSRLRRALAAAAPDGADVVATEPDGYRVDLEGHDLDADRFEMLVARARQDLDADPEGSARQLDQALGLWRGAAFGELADLEFLRAGAVRLEELRAGAIADRVDARLAAGDHQAVIGDLQAVVAAEPLAERPHSQLMLALYRSSRQADALAVYQQLRQRLVEELGVDPSPEVQELYQRILQQDTDLAAPARTSPVSRGLAAPQRPDTGGPSPPRAVATAGDLVGRHEDMAAVTGLVTAARLVTLTGAGGVGKSRLAEAVAAEVAGHFDDGVVWCALAAVRDPGSVTAALVTALRVQHQGDESPEDVLLAALGTRRLLLVLDNCEHLLDTITEVVAGICRRCPNVVVLATSREHLHLSGERVWEVTPLPVPRADADAAGVAATPAGALFCTRAREVEPSFALTDANAATVAALCRRLDGIPLAIELAAARVRALALDALAARIDQRFELLTGGSHRDIGRHRTLHAMVAWSYKLLTDAQARLFDRLSVFAGPFPLTAAEQVCGHEPLAPREVAGLLAELVDKSLVAVDRTDGGVRYRLLDTLRGYGAQRLEETGGAERTHRHHAAYHVRLAEESAPEIRGPDERAALVRLDAAFDDLRVAHAWLVASGDVDGALRLPSALHDDLVFRPREEVFSWVERALELPGAPEQPAYSAALATAARGALNRGQLERAHHLAETALYAADPPDLSTLWALYVLTTTALYAGRLDDALAFADRRVALAGSLGEDYHRALAGVSRVLAQVYRGDADAALQAAADARAAAEASGNHTARAWALFSSGEALLETDQDEAATLLEQAIDTARRGDRPFIEGVALVSLASLCGRRGQTDRALALFRETVAHWRPLGAYTQQETTLRNLVEVLVRIGADKPAAVLHGAVTAGATPSFGAEADRLTAARAKLDTRLGDEAARAAAEEGRHLSPAEIVDTALAELDALLEGAVPTSRPARS
jgi:predicted ATPase/DNA-binding SARP family transcriptional activator